MFSGAAGSGSAALALKCGKCVFAEKTKEDGSKCLVVTPTAAEKGELSIAQAGADGVVHLKWTHRETGAVEPDGTYSMLLFSRRSLPFFFGSASLSSSSAASLYHAHAVGSLSLSLSAPLSLSLCLSLSLSSTLRPSLFCVCACERVRGR